MAALRSHIPSFDGGYSLAKSPLDGGQILQSTVAMSMTTGPSQALVDALSPLLPGGTFAPISFVAEDLMLVVHKFSTTGVLEREETLATAPLKNTPDIHDPLQMQPPRIPGRDSGGDAGIQLPTPTR